MDRNTCKFKIINCFANCLAAGLLASIAARFPVSQLIYDTLTHRKMENGSFRVHLPSNDLSHPDNTVANWRTQLPVKLRLSRHHQIALEEISFPRSWYNFKEPQEISLIPPRFEAIRKGYRLQPGNYEDEEELIASVNHLLQQYEIHGGAERAPQLKYIYAQKRVEIEAGEWVVMVNGTAKREKILPIFGEDLRNILGLPDPRDPEFLASSTSLSFWYRQWMRGRLANERLTAERAINLNLRVSNVFVYCNIVVPSIVGGTYSKILRVIQVPHSSKFGDQIVERFVRPFYLPICQEEIDEIEIHLKDDLNESVPFQFGRSHVVVEFQKKEDSMFHI